MIALMMTLLVPRRLTMVTDAIGANRLKAFFGHFGDADDRAPVYAAGDLHYRHFFDSAGFHGASAGRHCRFHRVRRDSGQLDHFQKLSRTQEISGEGNAGRVVSVVAAGLDTPYIGMIIKVFAITIGLGGVLLSLSRKTVRPIENQAPSD